MADDEETASFVDISKAYRGAHAVCEQGNFEAISAISNDISQGLLYTHMDLGIGSPTICAGRQF
jgi:hypothetical protein